MRHQPVTRRVKGDSTPPDVTRREGIARAPRPRRTRRTRAPVRRRGGRDAEQRRVGQRGGHPGGGGAAPGGEQAGQEPAAALRALLARRRHRPGPRASPPNPLPATLDARPYTLSCMCCACMLTVPRVRRASRRTVPSRRGGTFRAGLTALTTELDRAFYYFYFYVSLVVKVLPRHPGYDAALDRCADAKKVRAPPDPAWLSLLTTPPVPTAVRGAARHARAAEGQAPRAVRAASARRRAQFYVVRCARQQRRRAPSAALRAGQRARRGCARAVAQHSDTRTLSATRALKPTLARARWQRARSRSRSRRRGHGGSSADAARAEAAAADGANGAPPERPLRGDGACRAVCRASRAASTAAPRSTPRAA